MRECVREQSQLPVLVVVHEIISFPHPEKGFTPLWGCFERTLETWIVNSRILDLIHNMPFWVKWELFYYFVFFWKSQPSMMSLFQMCHNSFSPCLFLLYDEMWVSLIICAWGLLLSPFSFWSCFPSEWIAAISWLIWRCVGGPRSERAREFQNLGLPEEKEKSSLNFQNITTYITKGVKTLSNSLSECNSMFRRCL